MPFFAHEVMMWRSPFNETQNNTISPADSYLGPSLFHPPSLLEDVDMDTQFPLLDSDTNWMSTEPWDWDNAPSFQLLPMGANPSTMSKQLESETKESPYLSNGHTDLAKITEHEPSNFFPSVKIEDEYRIIERAHSPSSRLSSPPLSFPSSPVSKQSGSPSSERLADANSNRYPDSRRHSSSSDSQYQPKRRRSSLGKHERSPSIEDTYADPELAESDGMPKVKLSSKAPHSVVERRYRDNLNNAIAELDRTLSTVHRGRMKEAANLDAPFRGKPRKAEVLSKAMRYVKQAELDSFARDKEIEFLRSQITVLEKLVKCGDCALLKRFSSHEL